MMVIQPYVVLADLLGFELGLNKQPKSLRSFEMLDEIVRSDVRHRLFKCQNEVSQPPLADRRLVCEIDSECTGRCSILKFFQKSEGCAAGPPPPSLRDGGHTEHLKSENS